MRKRKWAFVALGLLLLVGGGLLWAWAGRVNYRFLSGARRLELAYIDGADMAVQEFAIHSSFKEAMKAAESELLIQGWDVSYKKGQSYAIFYRPMAASPEWNDTIVIQSPYPGGEVSVRFCCAPTKWDRVRNWFSSQLPGPHRGETAAETLER